MSALDKKVKDYWSGRDQGAVNGLVLLNACIEECAKSRNWDPLSRFISRSRRAGSQTKVARIIRLAFGDQIAWKADKDHTTGGRVTMKWEGEFKLAGNNVYMAMIPAAIDARTGWDDRAFSIEVKKLLPEKEAKKKDLDTTKAAKRVADLLAKLKGEGYNIGDVVREAQANVATRQNDKVVNGVKVVG